MIDFHFILLQIHIILVSSSKLNEVFLKILKSCVYFDVNGYTELFQLNVVSFKNLIYIIVSGSIKGSDCAIKCDINSVDLAI